MLARRRETGIDADLVETVLYTHAAPIKTPPARASAEQRAGGEVWHGMTVAEAIGLHYVVIILFSSPPLCWRTVVLRACSFSSVTHCLPCSAGFVLERTWGACRIVRLDAYVRLYPHGLLAVEAGSEPVEFPDVSGDYPAWGALRKRLLGRFAPSPPDCVGLSCSLLRLAGVEVPCRISTPAQLLRWLARTHEIHKLR